MSDDKYRIYYENFYSLKDYSYIDLAGIDLSKAQNLDEIFDSIDELIDFRVQLQAMTIDEIKTLITDQDKQAQKLIDSEYPLFLQKIDKELDQQYPLTGLNYEQRNQQIKEKLEERQYAIDEFNRNKKELSETNKASLYRDFCIVNKNIANKLGLTPQEWEQQKMRAKFEVEAEKAWAEKIKTQDYQEIILDESIKKAEEDQIRADKLAERFVKLPNIEDAQLDFHRTLSFNALIEAGMLDEAENVLIVYENLKDEAKAVLYGTKTKSMDES